MVENERKKINTKNSGIPKLLRWLHALCSDKITLHLYIEWLPCVSSHQVGDRSTSTDSELFSIVFLTFQEEKQES